MIYVNDPEKIPVPEKEEYWDRSEKDYRKKINLISGLTPHITAGDENDAAAANHNTPPSRGTLTDGNIPTSVSYDEKDWFKFARGQSRQIIFDITKISTVTGFRAVFMHQAEGRVFYPPEFKVALSVNGTDWETVFVKKQFYFKEPNEIFDFTKDFDEPMKARFVRFSFEVDIWVFIGQLEVYGTKAIQRAARDLAPTRPRRKKERNIGHYLMPEEFFGIRDLLLAYNCHPGRDDKGRWSVEWFKPFVGYYDREGNLKDYFFDAFLFLPFAAFPMRDPNCNADTWRMYVDNTFAEGYNTDALDYAYGETKRLLGDDSDRRAKVFLSILYPFKTQKNFGDLYGNGEKLDMSRLEDRKKAIKWLIDTQLELFKSRNYQNSELCGFYWYEEDMLISDAHDKPMITWTTEYVHSLGYPVIWIPYFRASGYNKWWNYGIDYACMQPNYTFRDVDDGIVYTTADITKKYGMCVEMEIGGVSETYIDKYNRYMDVGAEKGYMDAVHMYYQGGCPGEFWKSFNSDDKKLNDVYHDTYLFARQKYTPKTRS